MHKALISHIYSYSFKDLFWAFLMRVIAKHRETENHTHPNSKGRVDLLVISGIQGMMMSSPKGILASIVFAEGLVVTQLMSLVTRGGFQLEYNYIGCIMNTCEGSYETLKSLKTIWESQLLGTRHRVQRLVLKTLAW